MVKVLRIRKKCSVVHTGEGDLHCRFGQLAGVVMLDLLDNLLLVFVFSARMADLLDSGLEAVVASGLRGREYEEN